jgi:DNA replication protein DnaC
LGLRVPYFTAADLVETLYRGLADNSVGRVIDTALRVDLVILDEPALHRSMRPAQLFFRFIAAAYERRSLRIASHWPFDQWGRFLPDETTAVSMIDRILHHAMVVVTEGESFRMKEAKARGGHLRERAEDPHWMGTLSWPKLGTLRWPLTEDKMSRNRM